MYSLKPVMQMLEKDEGAGGEVSLETVIQSKTGWPECLPVIVTTSHYFISSHL